MAEEDSLEARLAEGILNILDNIEYYSIDQVANICNVSKSTLSKFVRKLNFEGYKEFREYAIFEKKKVHRNSKDIFIEKNGIEKYIDLLHEDIDVMINSISPVQMRELIRAICKYEKIAAFGSLYSQTAAMDFVFQMVREGKIIKTYVDDLKQEKYFKDADENTLIIVFSDSGKYLFEERMKKQDARKDFVKSTKAKIALITSNKDIAEHPIVAYPLLYDFSTQTKNNVILSRVIITMIVNEYRKMIENRS